MHPAKYCAICKMTPIRARSLSRTIYWARVARYTAIYRENLTLLELGTVRTYSLPTISPSKNRLYDSLATRQFATTRQFRLICFIFRLFSFFCKTCTILKRIFDCKKNDRYYHSKPRNRELDKCETTQNSTNKAENDKSSFWQSPWILSQGKNWMESASCYEDNSQYCFLDTHLHTFWLSNDQQFNHNHSAVPSKFDLFEHDGNDQPTKGDISQLYYLLIL